MKPARFKVAITGLDCLKQTQFVCADFLQDALAHLEHDDIQSMSSTQRWLEPEARSDCVM